MKKALMLALSIFFANNAIGASVDATTKQSLLNAHNQARNALDLPPLSWSPQLASLAEDWVNHLAKKGFALEHRADTDFGENIYVSTSLATPAQAVGVWLDEKADYDYSTNSCKIDRVCGHYTQIVWKNTTEVGCATASNGKKQVWVCNYNPAGNWDGEKPY